MPAPAPEDDYKRRARRRLVGAVALTIIAVIVLPLVLEDEPPPAGPLEVHMPPASAPSAHANESTVQYAPPPANATVEPPTIEQESRKEMAAAPAPDKAADPSSSQPVAAAPPKTLEQADKIAVKTKSGGFTIQIGVFADKANVKRLETRIAAMGMKAHTEQVGEATRIRVGSFDTKAEADKVAISFAAAGIPSKVIEK